MTASVPAKPGLPRRYLVGRIALFTILYVWIGYACFDGACSSRAATMPPFLKKTAGPSAGPGPAALPPSNPVSPAGHTGSLRTAAAVEAPAGSAAVSWSTLGGFRYSKGMRLPASVRDLNGRDVSITGFMLILDRESKIVEFILVAALWSCCYGTPPDVNQVIMVDAASLGGVEFTNDAVQVVGTLDVGERLDTDGTLMSVYRLRAKAVRRLN